jgi:rhamnose transport system substrate-binding protein
MNRYQEEAHLFSHRLRPLAALSFAVAIVATACGGGATPSPSSAAPSSAASPAASSGASGSPAGSAATGGDLNIVFIPKAINNPYFDAAAVGAQKAATELGGQFKQIGSQNATAAEQIPFIQDATTQGYKAIVVSATGADEVAPALKAAKDAGIKVVGYDSSPAEGAYDVFVNQTDFSLIGGSMAQWACDLAPDCSGEIAILSATATATNQNAWIADFNKALTTDPKFAKLKLVDTVYGDDDATKSTNEANGLLQKHPDLKVIVAPTTVGILAAAQVVKQAGSAVKVTGLGLPNDMKAFVADGTVPEFGLWSVPDLGYLAYYVAAKLINAEITGKPGETFTVPNLNGGQPYTIGDKSVVILGPPFVFNKDNVNNFDF